MSFKKGIIAAVVLASSFASAVFAAPACPSADEVKDGVRALNTVMRQSQSSYFVLTAQPAVRASGFDWLLIDQAKGNGFDDAFSFGESDIKAVSMPAMEEAIEMQGVYMCAYFTSSGGMSVMAIAPQQQGATINPASLKLNELKLKK